MPLIVQPTTVGSFNMAVLTVKAKLLLDYWVFAGPVVTLPLLQPNQRLIYMYELPYRVILRGCDYSSMT